MRVYGYVRVSTKGQAPGTSLDEQTAEILDKYPTAVIVREVASGASERPEFKKICEQLETGDTLVVCKLDRFCRTAKEVYWMRNPTTYRLSVGGTFFPVKT